ncbi:hypothetical protein AB838_06960 [Rhodobacteraceae bacterium (ex Bugula neritina AB1)]|nr:hypothetical protein AB838_06960 [Rhodobacteraceae bacterium (ex Bugula neritina AB1)]
MIKWVPAAVIALLAALALMGGHLRAYEVAHGPRCTYALAEQARPAADVVLIGASRVRRGLDPDYIEALLAEAGQDIHVDRLSLNLPNFPQYFPLLKRYVETRGAPRIAYLQLAYNFKPERQASWDLPVNTQRNLAFARMSELAQVQRGTPLNDQGTTLPRQLQAGFQSLPAAWLTRVEMRVFSALRYMPKRLRGHQPDCSETLMRNNGTDVAISGTTLAAGEAMGFVPPDPAKLAAWQAEAADFLPLAPDAPWRQGETAQLRKLITLLEDAGTKVVFLIMPSITQRHVDADTLARLAAVFPGIEVHFPMGDYDGPLAEQISVSFVDTHHVNDFGAVYLSRALARDLAQRLEAQ